MTWLLAADLLLALGFALRLTRLIVTDDLGYWLIGWRAEAAQTDPSVRPLTKRALSGLSCPHCVGFWLGGLVLLALAVAGGPGSLTPLAEAWRWVAGSFTLGYVVGHVAARLDA